MALNHTFRVEKNVLTDNSVIWEIWHDGLDERFASAATEREAFELEVSLNLAITDWLARSVENSIDI